MLCFARRDNHRRPALGAAALLLAALGFGAAAAPAEPPEVLVFGDSLAAGYGLPPEEAFPAQLATRLAAEGVSARVVAAGVSGDTTADGLRRLDWALADKPAVVILELGANDALRGLDPGAARANLDTMIGRILASGAKVLLAGMLAPANWGEDYKKRFDAIYPALAKAHRVALYPFFLDGVAMQAGLNQPDGLHPNARGAALVAERIAPYVAKLLGGPS